MEQVAAVQEPRICCRCGKDMRDPETGILQVGVRAYSQSRSQFEGTPGPIGASVRVSDEFMQKQLGPYKLGKVYELCMECWWRRLGIVEEDEGEDEAEA